MTAYQLFRGLTGVDGELLAAFRREFTALAAYYGVSPVPLRLREET